jgi:hypothetical protein
MVCILVFSGTGVFSSEIEKKETITTESMPPAGNVLGLIKGGFGISIIMKSNILIQNTGIIDIYMDGGFIHDLYTLNLPEPIPQDTTLWLRTSSNFPIFGFGPCVIDLYLYLYKNSWPPELRVQRLGFILGPFILMRPSIIYIYT